MKFEIKNLDISQAKHALPWIGPESQRAIYIRAEEKRVLFFVVTHSLEYVAEYLEDDATIYEEGETAVNGEILLKTLAAIQGLMQLKTEGTNLIISHSHGAVELPCSALIRQDPGPIPNKFIDADLDVKKVEFCIAENSNLSIDSIESLYIVPNNSEGKIELVGMNGASFVRAIMDAQELREVLPETGILIRKDLLKYIKKNMKVAITPKRIFLNKEHDTLSLPLSQGTYPDYTVFLKKFEQEAIDVTFVKREDLLGALERQTAIKTATDSTSADFDFNNNNLKIECRHEGGRSVDNLPFRSYNLVTKKLCFNINTLKKILSSIDTEEIAFSLINFKSPVLIQGEGDKKLLYIIMPIVTISDVPIYDTEPEPKEKKPRRKKSDAQSNAEPNAEAAMN